VRQVLRDGHPRQDTNHIRLIGRHWNAIPSAILAFILVNLRSALMPSKNDDEAPSAVLESG
jgi:hypothetical protein